MGVTFLTSEYEHEYLRQPIHHASLWLVTAMVSLLVSMIGCVIHNWLVSRAVSRLSDQVTSTFEGVREYAEWYRRNPRIEAPPPDSAILEKVKSLMGEADNHFKARRRLVATTNRIGVCAIAVLIIGYSVGLASVVDVIAGAR